MVAQTKIILKICYMPDTSYLLSDCSFKIILKGYYPHFTGDDTETERDCLPHILEPIQG